MKSQQRRYSSRHVPLPAKLDSDGIELVQPLTTHTTACMIFLDESDVCAHSEASSVGIATIGIWRAQIGELGTRHGLGMCTTQVGDFLTTTYLLESYATAHFPWFCRCESPPTPKTESPFQHVWIIVSLGARTGRMYSERIVSLKGTSTVDPTRADGWRGGAVRCGAVPL